MCDASTCAIGASTCPSSLIIAEEVENLGGATGPHTARAYRGPEGTKPYSDGLQIAHSEISKSGSTPLGGRGQWSCHNTMRNSVGAASSASDRLRISHGGGLAGWQVGRFARGRSSR